MSIDSLCSSYQAFKDNNAVEGHQHFRQVSSSLQNRTYEQLWINRNRPPGDFQYGEHAFNNTHGLSSSCQEKAKALDPLIEQVMQVNQTGGQAVYRTQWDGVNNRYERVFSHREPEPNMKEFREALEAVMPQNIDPETNKTVGYAVAGTITLGYVLVMVCEAISKLSK